MREITIHRSASNLANDKLRIEQDDGQPKYVVYARSFTEWSKLAEIKFHDGDLSPAGPNGVTEELFLAIVIDRLKQGVPVQNPNHVWVDSIVLQALSYLETAMLWLKQRKGPALAEAKKT